MDAELRPVFCGTCVFRAVSQGVRIRRTVLTTAPVPGGEQLQQIPDLILWALERLHRIHFHKLLL